MFELCRVVSARLFLLLAPLVVVLLTLCCHSGLRSQVRKRVERAFRLLSPFNGGRLSAPRFQLLARVVKAGHWPQAHLFCFFDRDGDGAVSVGEGLSTATRPRAVGDYHCFFFLSFWTLLLWFDSAAAFSGEH
jgi:hypothetical protein